MSKGFKDDLGKDDWSLLPWEAVKQVVRVFMVGAAQPGYTRFGWKTVTDHRTRYANAAMRHLTDYMQGQRKDPKTGLHPLAHCACDILILLARDDEPDEAAK